MIIDRRYSYSKMLRAIKTLEASVPGWHNVVNKKIARHRQPMLLLKVRYGRQLGIWPVDFVVSQKLLRSTRCRCTIRRSSAVAGNEILKAANVNYVTRI